VLCCVYCSYLSIPDTATVQESFFQEEEDNEIMFSSDSDDDDLSGDEMTSVSNSLQAG